MFYNSIINIVIMMIYVAVGYFSGYKKYINAQVNTGLNKIILNITLPCMVLASFKQEYNSPNFYKDLLMLFIMYVIFKAIWFTISIFLFKRNKDNHFSSNRYSMLFPNSGFMGMPMTQAILGNQALVYTSIYVIFFNIFNNSLGIMIYQGKAKISIKELVRVLLNPVIVAAFIGILFFAFNITLPNILITPISSLGNMTTPLSFMTLGYTLTKSSLKGLFKGKTQYIVSALKLIAVPISALLIFRPILGNSLLLNTFIVVESMPVATLALILSNNFKINESEYVSKIVFLSTILTLITVPLIAFVISFWR